LGLKHKGSWLGIARWKERAKWYRLPIYLLLRHTLHYGTTNPYGMNISPSGTSLVWRAQIRWLISPIWKRRMHMACVRLDRRTTVTGDTHPERAPQDRLKRPGRNCFAKWTGYR